MALPTVFRKGQRLAASQMNAMLNIIKQNQAQISRMSSKLKIGGVNADPAIPVRVFNDTGSDLEIYQVAGIKDQAYTGDTQKQLARCFEIEDYDKDKHYNLFVIANQLITYQTVGWAWLAGGFYTLLDVKSEHHQFAAPEEGSTYLVSAPEGPCTIQWVEAGLGEKYAIVSMNRTVPRWYRAERDQSSDDKTEVYQADADGAKVGQEMEVKCLPESPYIIKDDWVRLLEAGGEIFVYKAHQYEVSVPEENVCVNGWDRTDPNPSYDGIEVPILYDPDDTDKVAYLWFDYKGELMKIYGSGQPSPTPGPTNTQPPSNTPTPGPSPSGTTTRGTKFGTRGIVGTDASWAAAIATTNADGINNARNWAACLISQTSGYYGTNRGGEYIDTNGLNRLWIKVTRYDWSTQDANNEAIDAAVPYKIGYSYNVPALGSDILAFNVKANGIVSANDNAIVTWYEISNLINGNVIYVAAWHSPESPAWAPSAGKGMSTEVQVELHAQ